MYSISCEGVLSAGLFVGLCLGVVWLESRTELDYLFKERGWDLGECPSTEGMWRGFSKCWIKVVGDSRCAPAQGMWFGGCPERRNQPSQGLVFKDGRKYADEID